MDAEALRIHDLVVEAGALLDWVAAGTLPAEAAAAALDHVRGDLCLLAELTADADACAAACGMVAAIDTATAAGVPYAVAERGAA